MEVGLALAVTRRGVLLETVDSSWFFSILGFAGFAFESPITISLHHSVAFFDLLHAYFHPLFYSFPIGEKPTIPALYHIVLLLLSYHRSYKMLHLFFLISSMAIVKSE
jgi:hypothetical protein